MALNPFIPPAFHENCCLLFHLLLHFGSLVQYRPIIIWFIVFASTVKLFWSAFEHKQQTTLSRQKYFGRICVKEDICFSQIHIVNKMPFQVIQLVGSLICNLTFNP